MSTRKGKVEKASSNHDAATDSAAMILDYLREQNRPYSAVEISANLHNKVTKTTAAKVLRELQQNQQIEGRISGKQTVYHSLQSQDDDATPEAIAALDQEVKHYQDQLTELKTREKQARTELATLCARPRLSDLRNDVDQLDREKARLVTRLTELRADNSTQVSPEEKAKVDNEWKLWQKQVNLRRRICYEMWGRCSEVLPEDMTRDELWESLGLEGTFKR